MFVLAKAIEWDASFQNALNQDQSGRMVDVHDDATVHTADDKSDGVVKRLEERLPFAVDCELTPEHELCLVDEQ